MMDNQQHKISGYRDLSQQEIDLINQFKELEKEVGRAITDAKQKLYNSGHDANYIGEGTRCLNLARTNFQQAFMWAVRSVAQPESLL